MAFAPPPGLAAMVNFQLYLEYLPDVNDNGALIHVLCCPLATGHMTRIIIIKFCFTRDLLDHITVIGKNYDNKAINHHYQ